MTYYATSSTHHGHNGYHDTSSDTNYWAWAIGIFVFLLIVGLCAWAFRSNGNGGCRHHHKVVAAYGMNDVGANGYAGDIGLNEVIANEINDQVDAFYRNMQSESDMVESSMNRTAGRDECGMEHSKKYGGRNQSAADFETIASGINAQVDEFYRNMKADM